MITVVKADALNPKLRTSDVRAGATSASSMERIYLCRGSYQLEKGLKEPPREASVRESGSRVHGALSGELQMDVLDEDEKWMYDECRLYEEDIVSVVFGKQNLLELESYSEDRLYMIESEEDGKGGVTERIIHSGEFDKLYIDPMRGHLLIIDYKTGFLPVTEPEKNYQLRSYAVLVWLYYKDKYQIETIEVAAIQPRVRPVYVRCAYLAEDFEPAFKEMQWLMRDANRPDAPRKAGEVQCKYCKALTVCDTAREKVKAGLMHIDELLRILDKEPQVVTLTPSELKKREALAPSALLAELYEEASYIEKWRDRVKNEMIMRLQNFGEIPGYQLDKTSERRSIKDPYDVRMKLAPVLSPRGFDECVSLTVGKVEGALKKKMNIKKGEEKQAMKDMIGDHIVMTGGNPTVKRVATEDEE